MTHIELWQSFIPRFAALINHLSVINYLFNLIIWEHLSPVQFKTGVCRKLCDKFKILKNLVEAGLFESNICVFCGRTSLKFGLLERGKPNAFGDLSIFKLKKVMLQTFLLFFLCNWRKHLEWNKLLELVAGVSTMFKFWGISGEKTIFLERNFLSPILRRPARIKKSIVSASETV